MLGSKLKSCRANRARHEPPSLTSLVLIKIVQCLLRGFSRQQTLEVRGVWCRKSQLDIIQSKEEEKQIKSCSRERTLTASDLAPSGGASQGPD